MTLLSEGVRKVVLDNGLTVLLKENHSSPTAAIYTYVQAGYFNERDDVAGISHLTEHMFFKGTARRGVGEIARETRGLGGFLNASTIYDHTLYYTVLPAKYLWNGLDIQSDALMNSVFDPEELRKETEVVIEECKRKLDMPAAVTRESMFALAFAVHRMRRWRIGTEEGLRRLTRTDFLTFYANLYRPENIILTVAGDIDLDRAQSEVEKYYGHFEKGKLLKEPSPAEPSQTGLRYKQMTGKIQQSHLALGFHTPGILHPDSYALEVLAFVLGQGRSSRLSQRVKEMQQLVDRSSAYNYALQDIGIFVVEAICRPESSRDVMTAIASEIADFQTDLISPAEIEKARNQIEAHYIFSQETAAGQAGLLASYEALGDYRLVEEYLAQLHRVEAEDVQRVARKYLALSNCSVLEYLAQHENSPALHLEQLRSLLHILPERPAPDSVFVDTTPETAGAGFVVLRASDGREGAATRFVLPNGVTLIAKENHQVPLVATGLFIRGGRPNETVQNCGISGLTARSALRGTRTRTAAEVASEVEGLGSNLDFASEPDYLSCTMTIMSKHLKAGWSVLADVLRNPIFAEEEVAKEQRLTRGRIKRLRDDTFRYPLSLFYPAIFGNHAYGLPALGTVETIEGFTRDDLERWHFRHLSPEKLVVVAVGDFEPVTLQNMVEASFADLSPAPGGFGPAAAEIEFAAPDSVIEASEKEQTVLVLGFRVPAYGDGDRYTLTVLQNALSGLGGRFFEELRGRRSLAYTVVTYLVAHHAGGTFLTYIATSPDKERKAQEGLIQQFIEILRNPIAESELRRSINYTVGTYEIGLSTSRAQMSRLAHNELLGLDMRTVDDFPSNIERVSAEEVLEVARRYLDLERSAQVVVRGRNT